MSAEGEGVPLLGAKKTAPLGSEVIANKGAVARDHMANERTFLAWLRTSLSLTTIGIGIVQLFKLQLKGEYEEMTKFGKPIGAGFFLLGISVLLFGCYRFFNVQALLLQDKYPISYFSVSSLVASVFVLVFATVVVVFTQ
ncbi:hypothetical protein CJI97_005555 [Candidozyma auris]|nr:hypothetical protein CJI97_005555 [[Candida] auris]